MIRLDCLPCCGEEYLPSLVNEFLEQASLHERERKAKSTSLPMVFRGTRRVRNIVLGLGFYIVASNQNVQVPACWLLKPRFPITECHGNLAKNENNVMLMFRWRLHADMTQPVLVSP